MGFKMNREEFPFKVGDKIKQVSWIGEVSVVKILYLGKQSFFAENSNGNEWHWGYEPEEWELYQEPKKTVKRWLWRYRFNSSDGTIWVKTNGYHTEKEFCDCYSISIEEGDISIYEPIEVPGLSPWETEP